MYRVLPVAAILLVLASCNDGDDGLPAPRNLRIASMAVDVLGLQWEDTSGDTLGHRVYREEVGAGTGFQEIGEQVPMLSGYTDNTVTLDVTYRYYVVSFDATEESARSNTVEVIAAAPYVNVLTPTSSDTLTLGGSFEITWDTNVPGFDANILLYTPAETPPWNEILFSSPPVPGQWTWTVGDDASGVPLSITTPQAGCIIRVEHYDNSAWSGESEAFTID